MLADNVGATHTGKTYCPRTGRESVRRYVYRVLWAGNFNALIINILKTIFMDELIEKLKKDFSGDTSYLSGVNDGMYHLLKNLEKTVEKAKKWDELDAKIAKFYPEDESEETGDLCDIGEICAMKFGYL